MSTSCLVDGLSNAFPRTVHPFDAYKQTPGVYNLMDIHDLMSNAVVWGIVGMPIKPEPQATAAAFLNPQGFMAFNPDLLDGHFDCDFTKTQPGNDTDGVQYRGGFLYERPYGFYRHALMVSGKFGNDDWLGSEDPASGRGPYPGEWPVSYHGTALHNAMNIADQGHMLSKDKRFRFGRGIYTTPSVSMAFKYATKYQHNGKWHGLIFQNRVNPDTMIQVDGHHTGLGEYWISPDKGDVRPYAICIKEL